MQHPYPWQIKQWQALLARWHDKKLPHALLLAGPKGLGKLDFAKAMAARLLCQKEDASIESACGSCQSCQWLQAESHPDFYCIQPEAESHIVKIEQVRELLASLQQTAQRSGQQVVLLEPAEAMNKAAANALLKVLEEPFGQVTFLLISHQPGTLPATIRSRCQKVDFPIPPVSTGLSWLKNQLPATQNIELLLALAENIPLRAITFAEESQFTQHTHLIHQFLQLSYGKMPPLSLATFCANMPAEQVYEGLCLLLKDIIRLQQSPTSAIVHTHELNVLTSLATQISSRQLFNFLDQLIEIKKYLNSKIHLNMPLLWESLFIEWNAINKI